MRTAVMLILPVLGVAAVEANAQAKPSYYLLEAMNSRKCAQVQGASSNDGAEITQWQCRNLKQLDPPKHFQWEKVRVDGEHFMLRAKHSGKCAQVNGASKDDGALVTQWTCQRGPRHFHWKQVLAENRAGDSYYFLVNRETDKCMHVETGKNENGLVISQWTCVDQPNVKWSVIGRGRIDP